MTQPLVALGFAKRQTPESRFTHWICSDAELCAIAEANLPFAMPGYQGSQTKFPHLLHNGICVVPVPTHALNLFRCGIVTVRPGDTLETRFEARRDGEEPRKYTVCTSQGKGPAKSAQIILYHREVLEADGEAPEGVWEIVSVNSSPTEEVPPIAPNTLMANHFGLSGGTPTGLTAEEFETKLRESFLWWQNKAFAGRETVAWLEEAYRSVAHDNVDDAIDNVLEHVDDMLCAGLFADLNNVLKAVEADRAGITVSTLFLGLCVNTRSLLPHYETLFNDVKTYLLTTGRDVERLLYGLEP